MIVNTINELIQSTYTWSTGLTRHETVCKLAIAPKKKPINFELILFMLLVVLDLTKPHP